MKRKINANTYLAIIFCTFLFTTSVISICKLMNFYVNDEIDYNEWNASVDSKLETDFISNLWFKYQYVNLNGAVRRLFGQREMNGVIKLNNGYLVTPMKEISEERLVQYAKQTGEFSSALSRRNIKYLYITMPYVVDNYSPQLPEGVSDYGNINLTKMNIWMREMGVDTLDLREVLKRNNMSTYDIFYHTDHHWTTMGGFWAYNQIVDYLEETNHDILVDETIRDINNYTIETYPKWHLGSNGQRTGIFFAGIDDYDLILPKCDTYLIRKDKDFGGSYEEMMIRRDALEKREYTSRYTYDNVYSRTQNNWYNPTAKVDKTVLIIGDSMSKAVIPFMALSFEEVLYMEGDVSKIDETYLDSYKPDIIISMYYPGNIHSEECFNWTKLWE